MFTAELLVYWMNLGSGKENKLRSAKVELVEEVVLPFLSDQICLDELWDTLGGCLTELAQMPDSHAVLVLQPAVEAFFLVHAGRWMLSAIGYRHDNCKVQFIVYLQCLDALLTSYIYWLFPGAEL